MKQIIASLLATFGLSTMNKLIAAYLLAVGWFFVPVGQPAGGNLWFSLRLALPALLLALGGLRLLPRLPAVAFFFCAVGDTMGVLGSFEGQMGGFAVAHICFICWFAKGLRRSKPRKVVLLATALCCLLPLVVAAQSVLPGVQDVPIRVGCAVYALLLTGTLWTSVVRAFAVQKVLPFVAATGALLFLVSDFILAWNKFTTHIPHASLYIMSTYYAALLLLFLGLFNAGTPAAVASHVDR